MKGFLVTIPLDICQEIAEMSGCGKYYYKIPFLINGYADGEKYRVLALPLWSG